MNCLDCTGLALAEQERCADCLEEIQETPNWRSGDAEAHRPKTCFACAKPIGRGKWCSESCRAWARYHPGKTRSEPTCLGCGESFRPTGADKWCASCRGSTPPCGQCGKPMPWRLSHDAHPARFCSAKCVGARQAADWADRNPGCSAEGCGKPSRSRGLCRTHYNKAKGWFIGDLPRDPERERARLRIKTHRRKDWSRLTDITPEYEMTLRAKAKRCPMCKVKLLAEPYLPASKELDHIVPRCVGGTHTVGNVRIICRACNLARPNDGSDYSGPVTLWAEVA